MPKAKGSKYADMSPAERTALDIERKAARDSRTRYQILYNGKDEHLPIVNYREDQHREARAFFKAEKKAGRDVSWWDVYDNQLSRMFSF